MKRRATKILAEGLTTNALIQLGEQAQKDAPYLTKEIEVKLQGIRFISAVNSAYSFSIGALAIYLYILDQRNETRPTTNEDFEIWLNNSIID